MSVKLRAPKGTHDLLPPDSEKYAAVEHVARRVFGSFGYGEIRTPVFESTELFSRSVGETTDIVASVDSVTLMKGRRELIIRHGADTYRLRITASNKLILTK